MLSNFSNENLVVSLVYIYSHTELKELEEDKDNHFTSYKRPSSESIVPPTSTLDITPNSLKASKELEIKNRKKKAKRGGFLSSLKRPLKRFSSATASPALIPASVSNSSNDLFERRNFNSNENGHSHNLNKISQSLFDEETSRNTKSESDSVSNEEDSVEDFTPRRPERKQRSKTLSGKIFYFFPLY